MFSARSTARSFRRESPIVHFRRAVSSVSPSQIVSVPSRRFSCRQSIGMELVGRWWCGKFHSTPPEIHAPSMPMSAGFTTCWR